MFLWNVNKGVFYNLHNYVYVFNQLHKDNTQYIYFFMYEHHEMCIHNINVYVGLVKQIFGKMLVKNYLVRDNFNKIYQHDNNI